MLCKVIVCLLIAYRFESVYSKAWPDQYDRYNYMDPSRGWGNPYYEPRANYPAGDFGSGIANQWTFISKFEKKIQTKWLIKIEEPTTTTTAKPIYPTLFPKYQPSAPFPEPPRAPASGGHQFENDNQRQGLYQIKFSISHLFIFSEIDVQMFQLIFKFSLNTSINSNVKVDLLQQQIKRCYWLQ